MKTFYQNQQITFSFLKLVKNCLFFFCLSALSSNTFAGQWFYEPQVSLSAGYDNNPFLEVSSIEEDDPAFVTESFDSQTLVNLGGRIRLGSELESGLIAFDAAASAIRYDDSDLDRERYETSFLYQETGLKHDWGVRSGLIRSSSIDVLVGDPIDGVVIEDVARFEDDIDQLRFFLDGSLTSRFSEKLQGSFGLGYSNVSFDETTRDTLIDYEDFTVNAGLNRIVSEKLTVFADFDVLFYKPSESVLVGDREKEYAGDLMLGVGYQINERYSFSFSAGPGYVRRYFSTPEGRTTDTESTGVYNASVTYSGLRNTISLGASNSLSPFVDSGLSTTQNFWILISRQETLGGDFAFRASYSARDPAAGESLEREYFLLTPSMSWAISKYLFVTSDLRYREQELNDIVLGTTDRADSTAVTIGLRYDWGRKLIAQ